jgi:hypothetical protein
VSNVLSEEKKHQVIALGRLGWSLRRIQQATRIRRETAGGYLKAVGIPIRAPGGWGRNPATAAKPAIQVATDPAAEKPPDFATPEAERLPGRCPSSSACEPYREVIELGLSRGRNAMAIWQDLVDDHGFTGRYNSVKRFVRRQRGVTPQEARVVIRLDIDFGGLQIDATEEVFDHDEGNTGLEKMHRFGVPHGVWTDADTSQRRHGTCGPA